MNPHISRNVETAQLCISDAPGTLIVRAAEGDGRKAGRAVLRALLTGGGTSRTGRLLPAASVGPPRRAETPPTTPPLPPARTLAFADARRARLVHVHAAALPGRRGPHQEQQHGVRGVPRGVRHAADVPRVARHLAVGGACDTRARSVDACCGVGSCSAPAPHAVCNAPPSTPTPPARARSPSSRWTRRAARRRSCRSSSRGSCSTSRTSCCRWCVVAHGVHRWYCVLG